MVEEIDNDDPEEQNEDSGEESGEDSEAEETKTPPKSKRARMAVLFAVIIIEGYVVLSTELLAIRQTIPFVGSGTDTISIIIAAVLMPLAFGYYYGGKFKPGLRTTKIKNKGKITRKYKYISVRKKLIRNILISMVILLFGLSYPMLHGFFNLIIDHVTDHRLLLTVIYAVPFLVIPVYLLGQTIPLISNYFSKQKLRQITGRILFFSTLGSFLGAVFSTVFLMSTIGVHYTAALNFVLLAFLVFLLSKRKRAEVVLFAVTLAIAGLYLNSSYTLGKFYIVQNNPYNTIQLVEYPPGERHLRLNNSNSAFYTDNGQRYAYIEYIESLALDPLTLKKEDPKDILVIGAGGFTFGLNDEKNNYDFVDIDKTLRGVAEELFLKRALTDNKTFHPMPARAFFTKSDKRYDLILLDAYLGDSSFPEHLATAEFFQEVRAHLKDNGIVIANFIASPTFQTRFSRHIDNTLRQAFPFVSRTVVNDDYRLWKDNANKAANVIYIYRLNPGENTEEVYTDNRNRVFFDKRQRR